MERKKPLEDVVVLDLTRVLAGPYCVMILANLGAKIIKVERPQVGDDSRSFGPYKNGQSAYDKLFDDPQVKSRNMLIKAEQPGMGTIYVAGNPIKLSTLKEEAVTGPAPKIGEHTEEILKTFLNYSDTMINELKAKNVIF